MRLLMNISLIFMLILSTTAIPINASMLDFEIIKPLDSSTEQPDTTDEVAITPEFSYTYDFTEDYQLNPEEMTFTVHSNLPEDQFPADLEKALKLDIYKGDQLIKTYNGSQLKTESTTPETGTTTEAAIADSSVSYTVSLASEDLNLLNGHYKAQISMDHELISDFTPPAMGLIYRDEITYVPSVASSSKSGTVMTYLYFSDENGESLIPVSRAIPKNDKYIRTTINELSFTPPAEGTGLAPYATAPRISRVDLSSGYAKVTLKASDLDTYIAAVGSDATALEAISKTLLEIDYISTVKFNVDGKENTDYFSGADLSQEFTDSKTPQAYLGLMTSTGRVYLSPNEVSQDITVPEMFDMLKYGNLNNPESSSLIQTLPHDLILHGHEMNGSTLVLDLSEEFKHAFDGNQAHVNLMLESMVYSFTSMEGVSSIELLVEGQPIDSLWDHDLNGPISPKRFINPEI